MIADHEAQQRFDAISQMSAEIATLNTEIEGLKHARDAARLRAERAELVVRQLEVQIASPLRQVKTVYTSMTLKVEREEHDAKLAKLASDGWMFLCDGSFLYGQAVERYTTLIRTAPIEPMHDQPPMTAAATINESLTVPANLIDEAAASVALDRDITHSEPVQNMHTLPGLWNALYAMDRFAELVQHWPKLAEFAPRVYAVFAAAGCDMADVVIMKSFRFGHNADEWTLKAIFPVSTQIQPGTRTALVAAGFGTVIQRDGREFIFDLPQAWVSVTPRTVKADAVIGAAPSDPIARDRANLNAMVTDAEITHEAFHKALINSRLPHNEQDELLIQSRQVRVGRRIAAQAARIPSYQPRPINSFLTGGK